MVTLSLDRGPARTQHAFAVAIFADHASIPASIRRVSGPAHESRFGVYRNNVIAGLINALAMRYPVTGKLLWGDGFYRVARRYVTEQPPRSPVLLEYGASFPQFLRQNGQGTSTHYLADIAELESARTRAYHAADATPLPPTAFASLAADDLPELRVELHPSVTLLKSDFPVVSAWEANIRAAESTINGWKAECALIARPHLDVEVRRISNGAHAFISALGRGCSIGAAISEAAGQAANFDLVEGFDTLITGAIAVGLELPQPPTQRKRRAFESCWSRAGGSNVGDKS